MRLGFFAGLLLSTLGCSLVNSLDDVVQPSGVGVGGSGSGASGNGGNGANAGSAGSADGGLLMIGGQNTSDRTGFLAVIAPASGDILNSNGWGATSIVHDGQGDRWIVFEGDAPPTEPIIDVTGRLHVFRFDTVNNVFGPDNMTSGVDLPVHSFDAVALNGYVVHVANTNGVLQLEVHDLVTLGLTEAVDLQLSNEKYAGIIGYPGAPLAGGTGMVMIIDDANPQACTVDLRRFVVDDAGILTLESATQLLDGMSNPVTYDCSGAALRRPGFAIDPGNQFQGILVIPAVVNAATVLSFDFSSAGPVIIEADRKVPGVQGGVSETTLAACEKVLLLGELAAPPHAFAIPVDIANPRPASQQLDHQPKHVLFDPFSSLVFDIAPGGASVYELDASTQTPQLDVVTNNISLGPVTPRTAASWREPVPERCQ